MPEDVNSIRPSFRVLIPALFGEFPKCRCKSKGFTIGGSRWSIPSRYHNDDMHVDGVWERDLPCKDLQTTDDPYESLKVRRVNSIAHLYDDHSKRIYVRL